MISCKIALPISYATSGTHRRTQQEPTVMIPPYGTDAPALRYRLTIPSVLHKWLIQVKKCLKARIGY